MTDNTWGGAISDEWRDYWKYAHLPEDKVPKCVRCGAIGETKRTDDNNDYCRACTVEYLVLKKKDEELAKELAKKQQERDEALRNAVARVEVEVPNLPDDRDTRDAFLPFVFGFDDDDDEEEERHPTRRCQSCMVEEHPRTRPLIRDEGMLMCPSCIREVAMREDRMRMRQAIRAQQPEPKHPHRPPSHYLSNTVRKEHARKYSVKKEKEQKKQKQKRKREFHYNDLAPFALAVFVLSFVAMISAGVIWAVTGGGENITLGYLTVTCIIIIICSGVMYIATATAF